MTDCVRIIERMDAVPRGIQPLENGRLRGEHDLAIGRLFVLIMCAFGDASG
jgi:hypothetical protein